MLIGLAAIGAEFDIPKENDSDNIHQHVKVVVRPTVLDNNIHWQMFESDQQIVNLLREEVEFSHANQEKLQHQYSDQIIQLKNNQIPKGLVTLESIFNIDDEARKPKANIQVQQDHYEEIEVFKGKLLKRGKVCTTKEK